MIYRALVFCFLITHVSAFVGPLTRTPSVAVFSQHDDLVSIEDGDCVEAQDSELLHQALQNRLKDLKHGIGKRYVCRTQRGFLNIHYEPSDPFDCTNIVGQMQEGDIVTSIAPQRGQWIKHDQGGWSIANHGGFQFLEPIDDNGQANDPRKQARL